MKWLRSQPGVPAPGPNYDPANLSTWPGPKRVERSLNTLVANNDALVDEVARIREEMRLRPFG